MLTECQIHPKYSKDLDAVLTRVAPLQVKYKEKYEREKGKAMLDFETPTYVTAKEAQHMQSQVETLLLPPSPSTASSSGLFSEMYSFCLLTFTAMRLVTHKLQLTVTVLETKEHSTVLLLPYLLKARLQLDHHIQLLSSFFFLFKRNLLHQSDFEELGIVCEIVPW